MNTILTVLLLQSGGSPWENAVQQLQNVPHTLSNETGAADARGGFHIWPRSFAAANEEAVSAEEEMPAPAFKV